LTFNTLTHGFDRSPEPKNQTGSQQQAPPASDPNKQGQASSEQQPADASKDALKNLESNPSHILDKEAEKKTSKD
jgi:hypothetical protein